MSPATVGGRGGLTTPVACTPAGTTGSAVVSRPTRPAPRAVGRGGARNVRPPSIATPVSTDARLAEGRGESTRRGRTSAPSTPPRVPIHSKVTSIVKGRDFQDHNNMVCCGISRFVFPPTRKEKLSRRRTNEKQPNLALQNVAPELQHYAPRHCLLTKVVPLPGVLLEWVLEPAEL